MRRLLFRSERVESLKFCSFWYKNVTRKKMKHVELNDPETCYHSKIGSQKLFGWELLFFRQLQYCRSMKRRCFQYDLFWCRKSFERSWNMLFFKNLYSETFLADTFYHEVVIRLQVSKMTYFSNWLLSAQKKFWKNISSWSVAVERAMKVAVGDWSPLRRNIKSSQNKVYAACL